MRQSKSSLLDDFLDEQNTARLEELKGVLTVDYEAIRENCLNGNLPDEMKKREAVLSAFSCIEPVNVSKLSNATGMTPAAIHKHRGEMSADIDTLAEEKKKLLISTLNVVDYMRLFNPKAPIETSRWVRKNVLDQELGEDDGVPVNINGNIFVINTDNRRQIANHISRGPLSAGERPPLPENINLTPEFMDGHIDVVHKAVGRLVAERDGKTEEE